MLVSLSTADCSINSGTLSIRLPDGSRRTIHLGAIEDDSGRAWSIGFKSSQNDAFITGSAITSTGDIIVQRVLPRPQTIVSESPITPTVIVAALGLAGTLLAAALTEHFAHGRETRSQAAARRLLLFQHYEAAYRQFLATWSPGASVTVLKAAFQQLRKDAMVTPDTIAAYERAVEALSSPTDPKTTQQATEALHDEITSIFK